MHLAVPDRLRLFVILSLTVATAAADPATNTRRVRAHTEFLADDLLEGRAAATRGYELAARYVAAEFSRLGLEPVATGEGYRQPVPFLEITHNREIARLIVEANGKQDALKPLADMVVTTLAGQTKAEITAPAVFVGYGVQAPELDYDDMAGVDLQGKIAVVLSGAPPRFPGDYRAHYSTNEEKRALLARHGAIGMVTVSTPADAARRPWRIASAETQRPAFALLDATGAVVGNVPGMVASATLNPAAAGRLFVASPRPLEEIFATAARSERQGFPLNVTLTLAAEASTRPISCTNILAWRPGTDAALAGQPVVVTAHLDHLGMGTEVKGDKVFNGAMDNAIGIGVLLAVAEELAAGPRLRRPILFAALTAEEKGLLGAKHLAEHPPMRVQRYAANVNLDMPLFMVPVRDVIAWGAEHSSLGSVVKAAARRTGFSVSPDFMPAERIFVRSDQYAFIRKGVPSLMLGTGQKAVDPATNLAADWQAFLKDRYHKRTDDLAQPIDWNSGGAYAGFVAELVRRIAKDPRSPAWVPGDFFGELFGPKP
jgi:hypothetical protein